MPKEKKETIETTQKIILPSSGDDKTDQELIDNFLSHSDEEYEQMGKEIEEAEGKRQETESKKQEIEKERENIEAEKQKIENERQEIEKERQEIETEKENIKSERQKIEDEKQKIEIERLKIKSQNIGKGKPVSPVIIKNFETMINNGMDELSQYRETWEKNIRNFSDEEHKSEIKEKIIEATKNIEIKVTIDNDGSRYVGFKLGNHEYMLLDPNLKYYIDDEFKYENYKYRNKTHELDEREKGYVSAYGMWGDDISQRKNQMLKKYIKEKQLEGLHVAKIEEIKNILKELGKLSNINDEYDQVAMFMYLTGINGYYWLSMGDNNRSNNPNGRGRWPVRSSIMCSNKIHSFGCSNYDGGFFASILMLSSS